MKGRKRTLKKFAALVLVLIMCFSVSIGGTYAVQNSKTGILATEVFAAENAPEFKIFVAEEKIKLLNVDVEGLSFAKKEYMNRIKESVKYNLKHYKKLYEDLDWQEWNLSKFKAYNLLKDINL